MAGPRPATSRRRLSPRHRLHPRRRPSQSSPRLEPPALHARAAPEPAPEPVAPREPLPAVAKAPPATPVQPPAETAPAPAPVTRGGWAVQVGAFGSAAAAQRLVKDLQGAGYRAFVSPVTRSGKTLHRVRVGPEAGRDDANRLAERLKGRGLPTAVVAND